MRSAAFLTLLATLCAGVIVGAGRPVEASSLRRAYFRVETADAGRQIAPYAIRELPGGIVSAAVPPQTLEALTASPGITFLGLEAVYHPAPIAMEELRAAASRLGAAAEPARSCLLPDWVPPVGWGIRAMYDDPSLVRPSGGAGVRVGVIDTGVSPHLDLVRRLVKCMDLTPSDILPPCADSMNHGTLVASVIAADGGADGLGMWGVAPEAEIYSYRVCEPNRECWGAYVAAGIYAAIADSMNIINMSLDGPGHDAAIQAAIDEALAHNILVVGAAGNSPPFSYIGWPASYPEVVSVGAINEDLEPWLYSAPGFNDGDYIRESREIEFGAPGAAVLAALKSGCWVLGSGTSLAAPMVAGLAAKLWSGSAAETRSRLQHSARFHDLHVAGDDTLTGLGLPTAGIFPAVYFLTAIAGPAGTVSPGGVVQVASGATQTYTITASPGCAGIRDVKVDGVSQGRISSYTFANMSADHTIEATFDSGSSFTVTASAGPGGTISPGGVSTVACGDTRSYVIAGVPGCGQIQDVKVDGLSLGPITSYSFSDVRSNHTISATFLLGGTATYTITATAGSGGTISPGGASTVPCGGSRSYVIAPSQGCTGILDVKVDGVSLGPISNYTFTNVSSSHTISAVFSPAGSFSVTASAGSGGTISPSGVSTVTCGGSRSYVIAAVPGCSQIQNVRVDGDSLGPITNYTFTNVTSSHTIAATFSVGGTTTYTISATAGGGGSITPAGASTVPCGGSRSYTITPSASCQAIDDVKVDLVSKGPISSYTFTTVTSNHTIIATFTSASTVSITATAGPNGTISPSGVAYKSCGSSHYYTFAPASCHVIQDVQVDGVSKGAISSYSFINLLSDHTIHATFSADPTPSTINAIADPGGTINPGGSSIVACGGVQSFTAVPDSCHAIRDILVDGASQGAISNYTFINVGFNHTIRARFIVRGPFSISAYTPTGGRISPSGISNVACAGSVSYTITPSDACHAIQDVRVDGLSQGPITSYTFANVKTNHTIAATFPALGSFTIEASAGPGGTISPSGVSTLACGSSRTYTIAAVDNCHVIEDVKVDGNSVGRIATHTFTGLNSNHTIAATFRELIFTVNAIAGPGGTISPGGASSVPCGSGPTYVISPADHCHVIQDVKVGGASQGPISSYTFTGVTSNRSIEATFSELGPFTITAAAGPGGTIGPGGAASAPCGESWSYAIAPADKCHTIQDVKVDGVSHGPVADYTFNDLSADHAIEAAFAALGPFTIEASAAAGSAITPSGATSVACGGSLSYAIAPAEACRVIGDVVVDGVSVGTPAVYAFSDVHADHTIAAASAPSSLALAETHSGATWGGLSDGAIDLTVSGGVAPYAYAWSNGATSEDVAALGAGMYDVRVTDAQGCAQSLTVTIENLGPAEVALSRPAPNPAPGAVQMRYGIPAPAAVRLSVVDLQGREIAVLAQGGQPAGWSWASWNGETGSGRAPGGIYFIRLQAAGRQVVQRFALIR